MAAERLPSSSPQSLRGRQAPPVLSKAADHWVGRFVAMACPCEVLIESIPEPAARAILNTVAECARRVEERFSRYRTDNVIHRINTSEGQPVVGDETANLLDFAARLTELSEGAFDITSGVLRRAWTFDGSDRVPSQSQIDALRDLIGWEKVDWKRPVLRMRPQMQIDFGGIGKEYAVDCAVKAVQNLAPGVSCLVNFGGDVAVGTARRDGKTWSVGIESREEVATATRTVLLRSGAIATSGDSRRYLVKDGKRYSHVLDARTGWPVPDAPHSVTVLADTCTQAGTFSTLALLRGAEADAFLGAQGVRYWLQ
jgi:thiamine biosynthesis lipoprotein